MTSSGPEPRDRREVDALARRLDALAADEASAVAEGAAVEDAPGEERVATILERAWAAGAADAGRGGAHATEGDAASAAETVRSARPAVAAGHPARRTAARRLAWLAAAAAVVAGLVLVPDRGGEPAGAPSGVPLGPGAVSIVEPGATWTAPLTVVWTLPPDASGWTASVSIHDAGSPGAPALATRPRGTSTVFRVPAEQTASWPDTLRIEVEARDASGQTAAYAEFVTSRSPPSSR